MIQNSNHVVDQYPVRRAQPKNTVVSQLLRWLWIVLLSCSVLQLVLFWSVANTIAVLCVIFAWAIVSNEILRPAVLKNFPLSSFIILGFTCTQLYFPLLFTLLEGKPIVFNLDFPVDVFVHSLMALLVLVGAHYLYRQLYHHQGTRGTLRSLMIRGRFFTPPSDLQMWLMGLLGLAAMYYVHFYSPSVGHEVSGTGDKFIQGMIPFTYAPFFIPFGKLYGRPPQNIRRVIPLLLGFTALLLIVSLGRNSRGAFMIGFASVGFAFGLGLLLGVFKNQLFTLRNVLVVVGTVWLLTGPVADLGTAMVMVRGLRGDIDRSVLIDRTLETFNDKQAIAAFHALRKNKSTNWDEHYMDNIFLARFSNLKYNDVSLADAAKIGEQDAAMFHFSLDRFWSSLPGPVLQWLALDVDKETVNAASFGDYLYYRAGAAMSALGGFRTGHFSGTGMAAFGWWYLLILGILMVPAFYLNDLFFIRLRPTDGVSETTSPNELRFSLGGLMGLTFIFLFLPQESVVMVGAFLLRGWLQQVVLYWLVFHLTYRVGTLLTR